MLKSPFSMSCVGMKLKDWTGLERIMLPWYPRKKNNLSFLMGPPIVPPN